MTVAPSEIWPEEAHNDRDGRDATRAYFARRRHEALDALAHPLVGDEAVAAAAVWLRKERDAGRRLPDHAGLGHALAQALDRARLPVDAANLRDDLARADDAHDAAPAAAALAARAAIHLLHTETDAQSWALVELLGQRDNRLRPAVAVVLEQALDEEAFRGRFFALAKSLVSAAAAAPEQQVLAHEREMFGQALEAWRSKPRLEGLWSGLRGLAYVHPFGSATGILREVARLDPAQFVDLLQTYDTPYLIWSAIEGTRASRCFAAWRALTEAAPVAFRPDGSWTGSVILPLLLVIATQAVARGAAPHMRYETADEAEAGGHAVCDAARHVATVLLSREDGAPAALRWSARLARQLTSASADGPSVPTDARDRGFSPWQLLAAVAQGAGADAWRSLAPADLPAEEAWFNLMAKAVAVPQVPASAGDFAALRATFLSDWPDEDDPEAWQGDAGRWLRAVSGVVRTFARQPTTLGVRLLAIPLTLSPDPIAVWIDLWRRGAVLREIVEFAEPQLSATSDDDTPWAPAELCWLIADLGLCIFDQIADERIALPYDRGTALANLLPLLWSSTAEMLAIDRFRRDTWDYARRHLVVRRALFSADRDEGRHPRVLPTRTSPTLPDMLRAMAAIERPFILTLTTLLDGGLPEPTLRAALAEAAINLPEILDAAERLSAFDERRAAILPSELDRMRRLSSP